ncbi:hypothetical protein CEV31_2539 [Brucella thiophenivorans]|uniref:Uncharacterized protein n=1 Tax=Brucella thiophenivorans TaxID=571255 RepID=A0A256FXQ0_9HYPH|nr:hypothetical protein CEV31_2539 [Brucella thiophenivorans]
MTDAMRMDERSEIAFGRFADLVRDCSRIAVFTLIFCRKRVQ